jgi:hypothetical protein
MRSTPTDEILRPYRPPDAQAASSARRVLRGESGMIDSNGNPVEIKVTRDPDGGWRVWVHARRCLAVRVYPADLHLDEVILQRSDDDADILQ